MKRLSWKYIAGLIDGEGCLDVQITKIKNSNVSYVRPRVRVALTTPGRDVLVMLKTNHEGHLVERSVPEDSNWSPSTSWELAGYTSCKFLRNIVNHLIIKKEQARFLLWMETNVKGKHVSTEVRDAIREELAAMKRDSHRLSERAQERILKLLSGDAIVGTV